MSEKHSPLPWHHRTGLENEIITDAGEDIVCRVPNHPENGKLWHLNAPLIVRAVNGLPEAIAALEPFAEMFLEGSEDFGDDVGITCTGGRTSDFTLTIGDFRRARAALAKLKAEP